MRKILCLLVTFSLLLGHANAQEEFVEPPSRVLSSIRFNQLTGGVVILKATLDNYKDTLNFILDSGSSGISLDSSTVAEYGLLPTPSDRSIRGIGGIRKVGFLYNHALHFPNLLVDSLDFHVNDYSLLTSVYGHRIDGIIGYTLLSRYIVKINYDSLRLDICSKGTIRYPRGGYLIKPNISTLPVQYARVKDEETFNARFLHDIGAGVCLMLSKEFVDDSLFLRKKRKLLPKEGEGIGGKILMHVTVVKELKIGPYRFRNVPTYIFDDVYNITSYPYLSGIIGNDIFRRFNVILNYPKRDIHLVPNSHFREPFDYSYSGIELYYHQGKTMVGSVAKDSPAEKGGVKEGDEVLGVNNDLTGDFDHFKAQLQSSREKLRILVRREGDILKLEFKVKSIL